MELLKHSFVSFSKTDTFNAIDYELFKFILSRSDLNVSSEIEVFNALVSWIEYDEQIREKFTFDLLKVVRLPLLSSEFIESVIRKHSVNCQKCCDHIDFVLVEKSKRTESTLENFQNENRCCMHETVAFMFYNANLLNRIIRSERWYEITENGVKMNINESYFDFHNTSYYLERCKESAKHLKYKLVF